MKTSLKVLLSDIYIHLSPRQTINWYVAADLPEQYTQIHTTFSSLHFDKLKSFLEKSSVNVYFYLVLFPQSDYIK